MLHQVFIESSRPMRFSEYADMLGVADLVLAITPEDVADAWGFYRKGKSNTMFTIERVEEGYVLSMDPLATYDDYRLFPYLVDSLSVYLADSPYEEEGDSAFAIYDEDWIEDSIGEAIAYLKCLLSMGWKYYIELPISDSAIFVSEEQLNKYGVTIHSSTPRIYGYVQYLMSHQLLPSSEEIENPDLNAEEEQYIDVPQHESIGTVRSWQTDGAETTESYSAADVQLLLLLAEMHDSGEMIAGVVLNDIGTIYENGIGVEKDIDTAIYWYRQAILQGDKLYAPTSLGDIYRRGYNNHAPDLRLALEAYLISEDPYAWYRIGQSYEEGWVSAINMDRAMIYYHRAAAVGHHLALRRLECEDE